MNILVNLKGPTKAFIHLTYSIDTFTNMAQLLPKSQKLPTCRSSGSLVFNPSPVRSNSILNMFPLPKKSIPTNSLGSMVQLESKSNIIYYSS